MHDLERHDLMLSLGIKCVNALVGIKIIIFMSCVFAKYLGISPFFSHVDIVPLTILSLISFSALYLLKIVFILAAIFRESLSWDLRFMCQFFSLILHIFNEF